jgi:hypothetical protein
VNEEDEEEEGKHAHIMRNGNVMELISDIF